MSKLSIEEDFKILYDENFGKDFRDIVKARYLSLRTSLEKQKNDELDKLKEDMHREKARAQKEIKDRLNEVLKLNEITESKQKAFKQEIEDMHKLHKIQEAQIKLDV